MLDETVFEPSYVVITKDVRNNTEVVTCQTAVGQSELQRAFQACFSAIQAKSSESLECVIHDTWCEVFSTRKTESLNSLLSWLWGTNQQEPESREVLYFLRAVPLQRHTRTRQETFTQTDTDTDTNTDGSNEGEFVYGTGLLQLQSVGIQDIYLTQDPQINVFKYSYFRYANFATETVKLSLNENATFGRRMFCDIPKRGHLLSKLYLYVKLPQLPLHTSGTYLCWSDAVGYAMFKDTVDLEIGGETLDRLYPQFMDIYDEFANKSKYLGRNMMVGKGDISISNFENGKKPMELVIPLDFWFTKQYSSALPIGAMPFQDIRVSFKLRELQELINYDGTDLPDVENLSVLDSCIFAEYIYMDDSVSTQFAKQKYQYVIEQVQYNNVESVPAGSTVHSSLFKFNHPVKEIFFACAEQQNVQANNYFAYSRTADNDPFLTEAALWTDGKMRFEFLPEIYYRTVVPDSVHSVVPQKNVYCIPFSIKPEDNQPTGTMNMSRYNDVVLSLKLKSSNPTLLLYVYAVNQNIVTVENGYLTLEFSS